MSAGQPRQQGHRLKPGHAPTATEAPLWVLIDCKGRNIGKQVTAVCGTSYSLHLSHLQDPIQRATLFRMGIRRHTLIAVLLTFLVALGPVANALAMSHSCAYGNGDMPMEAGHATHAQQLVHAAGDTAVGQRADKCPGCSPDCCNGGRCTGHACGSVVAVVMTNHDVPFNSTSGDLSSTDPQMMPGGRLTSLFRPPRT